MSEATTETPRQTSPASNGLKLLLTMGSVGFIAGILIVYTFQTTMPYIKANEAAFLEQAIFSILPGTTYRKTFTVNDDGSLKAIKADDPVTYKIYAGYNKQHQLTGVAVEAKGQGFQDVVSIIYGYDPEKKAVIGMKVLQSTETPGLGDKINSDVKFHANFDFLDVRLNQLGTALLHPIALIKGPRKEKYQISAITGATISSTAVTKMMEKSAEKNIPLIEKNIELLKEDK